jgi:hypothetical protein
MPMVIFNNLATRIPMQFTGLLDRHGTEIYEGDVVRVGEIVAVDEPGQSPWVYDSVRIVKWGGDSTDYPAFDLDPYDAFWESNALQFYASVRPNGEAIQVIGNIYETPELAMKKGKSVRVD